MKANGGKFDDVRTPEGAEGWVWTKNVRLLSTAATSGWPNLDTICFPDHDCTNTSNTFSCSLEGAAANNPSSEKAISNRHKNRYTLPADGQFQQITFQDLYSLSQGQKNAAGTKIIGYPTMADPDNERAVSIVGFVEKVAVSGCTKHAGESCNCKTDNRQLCDIHITVSLGSDTNTDNEKNTIVVEVTERSRRLASLGLLTNNNVGNVWTAASLNAKIKQHWVKSHGWLFFDADHFDRAWISDPDNDIGRSNFRETCWEVHPIMGIEVDVPQP